MESTRIRRLFLDYFADRGHRELPSSSLVPADDPTLLFTNAGMVQFKRTFLGQERREEARAVTCQKCVRAGGKHNDLEQVGLTRRHHTFFEMLGNFSFGDYFKRDAIAFAWEWVTSAQFLGIHPDRVFVTVHHSDDEAGRLWREVTGLGEGRVFALGDRDNFWQMGDTGPCGPCSEIYVDLKGTGGPRKLDQPAFEALAEAGDLLEIWNLVFMQYDRSADGTLTPLPRPSVDTGAGLERIAAVMQGEDDNFHTDLFVPLLDRVADLVGAPYARGLTGTGPSYRVLADHARAVAFLLADGVYPSNDGRGYVLRRILRRAVRHAWLLGRREPTLAPLADVVADSLGPVYPELAARREFILEVTETEERRFLETIDGGLRRLDELFASGTGTIGGDEAFKLYDTYGFPIDLTQLIAAERGVTVDTDGFDRALEGQRSRSRTARRAGQATAPATRRGKAGWRSVRRGRQKFMAYDATGLETDVLAFRQEAGRLDLLLHRNPFYAESGGQVSDTGLVTGPGWSLAVDRVTREARGVVVSGPWSGEFEPGDVHASVDAARRRSIERNHSATHLVHWALRRHLGTHVRQQGSLVEPERLRFDFSHHGPIEPGVLERIERDVNEHVWENLPVETREMPYADAIALGAMAFFADKYGDRVRVVSMGPSVELCGGTHVATTGGLGLFRFTAQTGVAAGVRRIEAVTGPVAYDAVDQVEHRLEEVATALKASPEHVARRLEQVLAERARLEARLADLLRESGPSARGEVHQVDGISVTVGDTAAEDREEVGQMADRFRQGKRAAALVLFGSTGRGAIHVAVTDDLVQRGLRAGDLLNRIAAVSGGKGGGRPTFASGSAGDTSRLADARAAVPTLVAEWLGGR